MTDTPVHQLDGLVGPQFVGIATFLRTPVVEDLEEVDIGMVGVPVDYSPMMEQVSVVAARGVRKR